MVRHPCVYLLASSRNGTLYVGVTSDLVGRMYQHKDDLCDGFSKQHGVRFLMWYECHESMLNAITREKQLKKWDRAAKVRLIERENPDWQDLWRDLI